MKSAHTGVLYIAFGERFQQEARQSIASVQRHSPDLATAVITDARWNDHPQPDCFVQRPCDDTFGDKPRYLYEASPFERSLFLDTDTVLTRDVRPIYNLLDYYEFGLRFSGPEVEGEPGLGFHPFAHSAALLYAKTPAVEKLFDLWHKAFLAALHTQGEQTGRGPPGDFFLAPAIAKSGVRVISLSSHILFNVTEPQILFASPVICHGRIAGMQQRIHAMSRLWHDRHPNEPLQRIWMPNIRGLLPSGLRRSDPFLVISLCWQRLRNQWRYRGKPRNHENP